MGTRANSVTSKKKLKELEDLGYIRYSVAKMRTLLKPLFIKEQKGSCGICETPLKLLPPARVVMDHDHKSKLIRGALCDLCNVQIGMPDRAGRGPDWYRKVADFLDAHKEKVDSGKVQMYIYPEPKPKAERRTTVKKKAALKPAASRHPK